MITDHVTNAIDDDLELVVYPVAGQPSAISLDVRDGHVVAIVEHYGPWSVSSDC